MAITRGCRLRSPMQASVTLCLCARTRSWTEGDHVDGAIRRKPTLTTSSRRRIEDPVPTQGCGKTVPAPEAAVPFPSNRKPPSIGGMRSCLTISPLPRSEEHTSELQSLMRISYAVFCLKKKNQEQHKTKNIRKSLDTETLQRLQH